VKKTSDLPFSQSYHQQADSMTLALLPKLFLGSLLLIPLLPKLFLGSLLLIPLLPKLFLGSLLSLKLCF